VNWKVDIQEGCSISGRAALTSKHKGGSMSVENKNYEVDNRTGINHEGADANKPVERLTASSIIGDSVENRKGETLGKIEELMVNVDTGKIEYAVLTAGGLLGVGKKLFAIP